MAKYYRRRTRSIGRRYTRAPRFRKYRMSSTRPGTKRFFRKQRRWSKPEVKYIANASATTVVEAKQISAPIVVMPSTIVGGAGQGQRVGAEIKSRYILHNIYWTTDDSDTTETDQADTTFRVVYWYPTENFVKASDYMNSITIANWQQIIDWNVVRVVRDDFIKISYDRYVITAGQQNVHVAGVHPSVVQRRYRIRWPRSMRPDTTTGILDPNKDILYMTVFNTASFAVAYDYNTKLTYIDP